MESEKTIQELIRICVSKHMEKKKFPISKTKLQKVLYKAKVMMSDSNPLKNSLPYFWYEHGPYSTYLIELEEKMISEGNLSPQTMSKGTAFTASNARLVNHAENSALMEARGIIDEILDESSSTSTQSIMDDVYRNHSPTKFYLSFKNEFQGSLKSFFDDPSKRYTSKHLLDILEKSFGDLPNATLFRNYKYLLRDFTQLLSHVFKNNSLEEHSSALKAIVETIFKTFALGIRIKYHDEFYNDKVESWSNEFNDSVKGLELQIIEFAMNLEEDNVNTSFVTFDDLASKIINLKAKNKLIMASFLPFTDNDELNNGRIDAKLFNDKSDEEFIRLIESFKNSKNAVIQYLKKNDIESENYKLITS